VSVARLLAGLLVALLLPLPLPARGQGEPTTELSEATIVERDAAVEVWVRLSRAAKYQGELMDSPWRLVLDFEDTAFRWTARPVPIETDVVRELRGSQYRKGVARLVIELRRKGTYLVEEDREGLRIVFPREAGAAAATPAPGPRGAPPLPPGPRPASKTPLVYGIVTLDAQKHAYIFDPESKQVRRYAVGDAVGDAVVETIGDWTVVLRTPGGRLELRVTEAKPDATATPARPAAPAPARQR
jgi:hypothetical protein